MIETDERDYRKKAVYYFVQSYSMPHSKLLFGCLLSFALLSSIDNLCNSFVRIYDWYIIKLSAKVMYAANCRATTKSHRFWMKKYDECINFSADAFTHSTHLSLFSFSRPHWRALFFKPNNCVAGLQHNHLTQSISRHIVFDHCTVYRNTCR